MAIPVHRSMLRCRARRRPLLTTYSAIPVRNIHRSQIILYHFRSVVVFFSGMWKNKSIGYNISWPVCPGEAVMMV